MRWMNFPSSVRRQLSLCRQPAQGPGKAASRFSEGRKALRACEIKLNPEAKRGGLFSGMKISTSKLTSSQKGRGYPAFRFGRRIENDPYSIPVNEALYTAAMEVNFRIWPLLLWRPFARGIPATRKMLHMLASHYVSRDMPAQAAEVYHDLVKLDPTDSVAVKSEKRTAWRAPRCSSKKWEEAKKASGT